MPTEIELHHANPKEKSIIKFYLKDVPHAKPTKIVTLRSQKK